MSTIERAIVKGTLDSEVEIRNMFTAQVTEVGGDTSEILWETYVEAFLAAVTQILSVNTHFYSYEVQQLNAGTWELLDEVAIDYDGQEAGQNILNAASMVLIGKAEGVRHVGRKFLGGLPESLTEGNILSAATAVDAAATLLCYISPVNGLSGGQLMPGVVDKNDGFWPFVGGVVSSLLGTMRRRKPQVGI